MSEPQLAAGSDVARPDNNPDTNPAAVEWGDMATAARAADAMAPAWKKFIKTKFYVAIVRSLDDDPKNYLLHMIRATGDGNGTLIISEVRDRLDPKRGDGIVALSGSEILSRLEDQGSILVALNDNVFNISRKRAEWLRSGIEVSKARVDTRNRLRDAAPRAPLPVLSMAPAASQLVPDGEDGYEAEAEGGMLARLLAALKSRYVLAVLVAVIATGVFVAILIPISNAPRDDKALKPIEEPVPARNIAPPKAAPASVAEPAYPFRPADNSFSAVLPGAAEEVELSPDQVQRIGDNRTHQYRLRFDDRMYTLEATDYMANAPKNRDVAMDAMQESIIGKDGALIQAKPVFMHGVTGREVRVRLAGGGERAARFAFIGTKFCMVMVSTPHGERAAPQIDAFLNSFRLN